MTVAAPAAGGGGARPKQTLAVTGASAAILLTGFTPYATAGLLIAFVVVAASIWRERPRWAAVGLRRPTSWTRTIGVGLLVGVGLQLFSLTVLAPLLKGLGSMPLDLTRLEALRGDPVLLALMLVYVWVFVALVEEIVFRGFLLPRIAVLAGPGRYGTIVGIAATAGLFGLAHWYQGALGVFLTSVTALVLGTLFVRSGQNLWSPVVAHGALDTVGLLVFYSRADEWLASAV